MNKVADILQKAGDLAVSQIKKNMQSTGTNASGKSSNSVIAEVKQNGDFTTLTITANPYFLVVETGRKPTPEKKPSREMVDNIREWMSARGMDETKAYGVALNINKKGSRLWRQGGRKDIVSNVITDEYIDEIGQQLLDTVLKSMNEIIVKTFKDGTKSV